MAALPKTCPEPGTPEDAFVDGVDGPTLRCDSTATLVSLTPSMLVGRSSKCDLSLPDPSVSGRHASIGFANGTWSVRDLGSRNGTRVDGAPLAAGQPRAIGAGSCIEFGTNGTVWRLIDDREPGTKLRQVPDATMMTATAMRAVSLAQVEFSFFVTADEEYARWEAHTGGPSPRDLGDRAYVYLLVTLARARFKDRELPVDRRGWMVANDLSRRLGMTPETLKVHVYRARKALAPLDLIGANGLVERRPSTNQIRLGTDRFTVSVV